MFTLRTDNRSKGFSLIEVSIAVVLLTIGAAALLTSSMAGSTVNCENKRLTEAGFLAQEIREWTIRLPFSDPDEGDKDNPPGPDGSDPQVWVDDLDDLMGVTYSPPRNAQGSVIADMTNWSQTLTLTWRNPSNLQQTVTDGASNVIYVEVEVAHQGDSVLTTGWFVVDR